MRCLVTNALRPILLFVCLLFVASAVFAQSSNGSISGTITDGSGALLPGVTVSARNVATSTSRDTVSTSAGAYTIPLLPPGRYEVTAELSGFKPLRYSSIDVNVGTNTNLDIQLQVGLEESVTVTADAPLVETDRSQVSAVVDEQLVQNLPVNGRNFLDFALTTPGVVRDVRLGDLSFGGQRGTLNSLVVDGANNDNTFFGQALGRTGSGRAPYQFSQDAVREFQINTNSYSAEYGRAGGAVINVITKSGTNAMQGTAFFFYRDKSLREIDYISEINRRAESPYNFDQYGLSLGGPIVRDKHFFFVNYDAQRNSVANVTIPVFAGATPTDPDTQAGLARIQALAVNYPREQNQDVYFVKTDSDLADSHLSFRFNRQEFTGVNFENGGPTNAFEHTGNSLVNTDTYSLNWTKPFGTTLFNEVRGQYARDREPGQANSPLPEATIRQNGQTVLVAGRNFFSPRETTIKRTQVADTLTWLVGSHGLKGGFDYSKDDILNFFPGNFSGSYTFDSIAAWQRGVPSRYVQAFAGPGTSGPTTNPDMTETAFFVQDEWRATPTLTINAGLRYDRQEVAQPEVRNPDTELLAAGLDTSFIPEDDDNVGPRLGFAWTPGSLSRTVIRAGYGIFYGRTPSIMVGTAHSNNGINVQTITFTGSQVPTYPNIFAALPTGVTLPRPTIFVFDPDFENPKVQQASVGVEHGLTNDLSVALSHQWLDGDDLPRSNDINVAGPVDVTTPISTGGSVTYRRYSGRRFANFARVIRFESSANSEYNGTTAELRKRFSGNWMANLSYTYATAKDDRPDATAVVPQGSDDAKYAQDPLDLEGDWSYSDSDVRHRWVLSGVWDLDYGTFSGWQQALFGGWTLSGIATWQSGQPYSALVNADLNNDGNNRNDRAPGFARNSFRLPDYFSLDPRITKEFGIYGPVRVQLIAEAFNITNHTNLSTERNTFYSLINNQLVPQSNFGTPNTAADPRTYQIAAKLMF
jgi:outer membrane receptor protein involved in Fe transport